MNIVFILNVGRSGSTSMARALNFFHEPDGWESNIESIQNRITNHKSNLYGETSHLHKRNIPTIKQAFPNAILIHLVRSGRKVVANLLNKDHYRYLTYDGLVDTRYGRNETLPIPGFREFTRFEKCCWYWKYWNEVIEKSTKNLIRLEDISPLLPKVNSINRWNPGCKVQHWNQENHETFNRICGETMERYGYV